MTRLFALGAIVLLLDVFPGSCGGCAPATTAGPCQTICDCDATMAAPVRCPGEWACNAEKLCEYSCRDLCTEDGGCTDAAQTCNGTVCLTPRTTCN